MGAYHSLEIEPISGGGTSKRERPIIKPKRRAEESLWGKEVDEGGEYSLAIMLNSRTEDSNG